MPIYYEPNADRSWWEGRTVDEIAHVLAETIPGGPPIEEVRDFVAMEREGEAHARATRAEVTVNILYDGGDDGDYEVTIPRGTVFTSADGTLRFLLAESWIIASGDMITAPLFADYSGEEYNIAAQVIDRIIEPVALNDLWNGAQILVDQPEPATGGSGPSGRLAAQARTPLEEEVNMRRMEASRPVMGIDPAHEDSFSAAIRAHVDQGGVIQFADGVPSGQVLVSDATSATWQAQPITQWTHNMASGTSEGTMNVRICDIDESCGEDERPPEPSVMEAWKD